MASVPSGFHFTPTKKEILNKFLTRKAKGEQLPTRLVVEKNIYDDQSPPWDIFTKNEPWLPDGSEFSKKHVLYVYTKLSYVSKATTDKRGPKNVKRRSGRGSWSGQRGDDVFNGNQEVIGYVRKFTYEPDKNWLDLDTMRKEYGSWTMHEFSLKGINGSSDYVFCKIMLNLNSKDGAVAGLLNEGITVIEQEDVVALINNSSQNNAASTSVVPFLPPMMMMCDQEREKEEGNIIMNLETHIVSNIGWIPESTYGYNNNLSFDLSDNDIIQLVDDNNNVSRKQSRIYGANDMGLSDFQNSGASDDPVDYFTDVFIGEDENGLIYCK